MTNKSQKMKRNWPAFRFGNLQLLVLVGLLYVTLQPGFKGGIMIIVIIAGTLLLQVAALFNDRVTGEQPESNSSSSSAPTPSPPNTTIDLPKSYALLRILLMVAFMLIVSFFLGVYAGFIFFLFIYWWRVAGFSPYLFLLVALLVGLSLPLVFETLVSTEMWPGIIPEIIPGFLGGAISPPF